MEEVEGDELSNHNFHSRHVFRMNSTSPSSESPLRRPAHIQHQDSSLELDHVPSIAETPMLRSPLQLPILSSLLRHGCSL
ncbi:hypothetical protein ACFX13_006138 [Malus domestica]